MVIAKFHADREIQRKILFLEQVNNGKSCIKNFEIEVI